MGPSQVLRRLFWGPPRYVGGRCTGYMSYSLVLKYLAK